MTVKLALTVDEAAEAVGVTEKAIRQAIRKGDLRAKRQSRRESDGEGTGRLLITVQALEEYVGGLPDA